MPAARPHEMAARDTPARSGRSTLAEKRRTTASVIPAPEEPFYLPTGDEVGVFEKCHARGLPVMLKGPTGCGKTRFVEHMAWRLGRPLVTVACHDDLSASDLTGRYLIRGGETVWQDGPLTRGGARGRHLLSRRDRRGAPGHGRRHPPADRRSAACCRSRRPASSSRRRRASSWWSPTIPAISTAQGPQAEHAAAVRLARVRVPATGARSGDRRARRGRGPDHGRRAGGAGSRVRRLRDRGLAEVPSTRLLVATARLIGERHRDPRRPAGSP